MALAARHRDALAASCFCGSGFLTLVYEVCWIRAATLAFGAATFALSTVLAVFFGGLAIGSYAFGRVASRTANPLRCYALLEVSVGLLAMLSPFAFYAAEGVFGWIYPLAEHNFILLSLARFALLTLVLLPPAILIGGTLPILGRHFVRQHRRMTWSIGCLYGLNTFGAAAGCAACGFWFIPVFGVRATVLGGGAINVLLGLLMLATSRMKSTAVNACQTTESVANVQPAAGGPHRTIACLFFATGFLALGNEVLWTRFLSLVMHNTVYTYTLTLTVILLGIVVGSLLSGLLFDRLHQRAFAFGAVQISGGLVVLTLLLLPAWFWQRGLHPHTVFGQLSTAALALFVPAVLSGISFPLAIRLACDSPEGVGARLGRLTAFNTLGGILGSLLIGFLILPVMGLQATIRITTAASLAVGFITWLVVDRQIRWRTKSALTAAAAALWWMIPVWTGAQLPTDYLAQNGKVVAYREGLSSHLAVIRQGNILRLEADRLWQGESRRTHQVMAAHLPMLFHARPGRVLVVGLGPGQTASRFLMYPIQRLDCVDIEAELVPLIREHFESAWLDDPRVRILVEDGRNYLTHTRQSYDIISIEVGQTFRPCVAGFYAVDFYQKARQRLKENGLFVQFVSVEFLGRDQFQSVVRSFIEVFPQSVLWYNRAELLLIGTVGSELRLADRQLQFLLDEPLVQKDLAFSYWGGTAHELNRGENLLAGYLAGPEQLARLANGGQLYCSDLPALEYATSANPAPPLDETVELLADHLGDVQSVLQRPLAAGQQVAIRANQRQNLHDLLASQLNWVAFDRISKRQLGKTIQLAERALCWNPKNFWSNLLMADALAAAGQANRSVPYYETAASLRPADAAVRRRLEMARNQSRKPNPTSWE